MSATACACGCGRPLPPGRTRWATDDCCQAFWDAYSMRLARERRRRVKEQRAAEPMRSRRCYACKEPFAYRADEARPNLCPACRPLSRYHRRIESLRDAEA